MDEMSFKTNKASVEKKKKSLNSLENWEEKKIKSSTPPPPKAPDAFCTSWCRTASHFLNSKCSKSVLCMQQMQYQLNSICGHHQEQTTALFFFFNNESIIILNIIQHKPLWPPCSHPWFQTIMMWTDSLWGIP